jgi:hypothetical protein
MGTPYFWVQQSERAIVNTVRCTQKLVIKDGGRQSGSTYISAEILVLPDSPTAIFDFRLPGTSNSIPNGTCGLLDPENMGVAIEIELVAQLSKML